MPTNCKGTTEDVQQKPDRIQRSLLFSLTHLPSTFACLHMLGCQASIPLSLPQVINPPLQTAHTATTSSKLAEDLHARYRSFSANYPCEYPSWTSFQTWTKSESCPKSIVTINHQLWVGLRLQVLVLLRKIRWKANADRAVTHSTHLSLTKTSQGQKEQEILAHHTQ